MNTTTTSPLSWPLEQPLLVEASAGTGKTYAITSLYVRLVVEQGIPVENLLTVTYTEAATRELRGRIRARLVTLREAFDNGASDDPFCVEMLVATTDIASAQARLRQAISGFDQAAIHTIHGFCQRALAESAFESAVAFDAEVLTSESELRGEILEDFWRIHVLCEPRAVIEVLVSGKCDPAELGKWIAVSTRRPGARILEAAPRASVSLDGAQQLRDAAYLDARNIWNSERAHVCALLLEDPALKRTEYRVSSVESWIRKMDATLATETPHSTRFDRFEKFTLPLLEKGTGKNKITPWHPFFDACTRLAETDATMALAVEDRIAALKSNLRTYLGDALAARKAARHCHSFDDLLTLLCKALQGPDGKKLAAKLRGRYPAALIDEFQDTDPVQLEIFRRIYAGDSVARVFVGDPKQAIYSFRGADLFAYLEGKHFTGNTETLDTNYRSDPVLVAAVNALFNRCSRPFVLADLDYPLVSGIAANSARLLQDGEPGARLRFRFLKRESFPRADKCISKERANPAICNDLTAEIVRLLEDSRNDKLKLDGRPLAGGDIAVLVRSHFQARAVHDALSTAGVPCVRQGSENVFASDEAKAMEQVMRAVAEPGHESLLRTALVSPLIGLTGNALLQLAADAHDWDGTVEGFRHYHQIWRSQGFMSMFRALLVDHDVYRKVLGRIGGERAMTNYLHIAELVQTRAHQGDAGMEILVTWLATMRAAGADDLEEAQLRLESDADRVKIITMHGAKGLEYPIVFCPFAWDGKLRAGDGAEVLFHDPSTANRATIDMGSGQLEEHRELARREEFSEFVRLLYVALTRAAQRCYVYWGAMNDAGTSPLAWLLHHAPKIDGDGWSTGELVDRFCALSDTELLADLESVRESQPEGIEITSVDPSITPSILRRVKDASTMAQALPFVRTLSRSWRVDSFTGLSADGADESPDHDGVAHQSVDVQDETQDEIAAEQSIHRYPRGARTGLCWHAVFEHIDFVGLGGETLHELVMTKLAKAGIDPAWAPATEAMVRNTLDVTLDTATGLRLNDIGMARRVNELGFFFSAFELRAPTLAEVLRQYGGSRAAAYADSVQRLSFEPLNGFLRGFIDLIFEHEGRYYLLDYKSNYLGPNVSHYMREHLESAMRRNGYFLQYLLYAVALHRYLRLRLPDYRYDHHFGGVYYLFLRGVTSSGDGGIYFDNPPEALIDALDGYFGSGLTP